MDVAKVVEIVILLIPNVYIHTYYGSKVYQKAHTIVCVMIKRHTRGEKI